MLVRATVFVASRQDRWAVRQLLRKVKKPPILADNLRPPVVDRGFRPAKDAATPKGRFAAPPLAKRSFR
jgi:hypothetical protein